MWQTLCAAAVLLFDTHTHTHTHTCSVDPLQLVAHYPATIALIIIISQDIFLDVTQDCRKLEKAHVFRVAPRCAVTFIVIIYCGPKNWCFVKITTVCFGSLQVILCFYYWHSVIS